MLNRWKRNWRPCYEVVLMVPKQDVNDDNEAMQPPLSPPPRPIAIASHSCCNLQPFFRLAYGYL